MKLQHLTIIFIIIIFPIAMVVSEYVNFSKKTVGKQIQLKDHLSTATYSAMNAFQMNTRNNDYSTLSNSKIRDIEASIEMLYKVLGSSLNYMGYNDTNLKQYTPAILCTLYDGYYIYTSYYDTELGEYTYGLKPFISYSCRYVNNDSDFVIGYSLDNSITVIGNVKGNYVTKSGYLLNDDFGVNNINEEVLKENLITLEYNTTNGNYDQTIGEYEYIIYNNQKIYIEKNPINNDPKKTYFWYSSDYGKAYFVSQDEIEKLNAYYDGTHFKSNSAKKYYEEAKQFTEWVNNNLGNIQVKNAVNSDGSKITDFATDLENEYVFRINQDNDPLQSKSIFNEHRMCVIRKSIETNLVSAIANYNIHSSSGYEFLMPKLSEIEWNEVENNICIVSFLQGIPMGSTAFNGYSVVSNNENKETVDVNSIYILTQGINSSGGISYEYHKPGCETLINGLLDGSLKFVGAYASIDFNRKKVPITSDLYGAGDQIYGISAGGNVYFYPQKGTKCYDCFVFSNSLKYTTDDILSFSATNSKFTTQFVTADGRTTNYQNEFLKALARTRYDLYKVNGYFGIN